MQVTERASALMNPPTATSSASSSSVFVEAIALLDAGRYDAARDAVERFLQSEALDHVQFGNGLLLLASAHAGMHAYDEADKILATCCGYLHEHLGSQYVGTATALVNRGSLLLQRYHYKSSLHNIVGARGGGVLHSDSASAVPSSPGDNPEEGTDAIRWVVSAKEHLERACRILQDAFGTDRLILADALHNLGCCCEILGGYTDAMTHYMRSLKIREKFKDTTGATDLKLAQTMEHIAMIFRLTDAKLPEASRILAIVAATRRRFLGPAHPMYLLTLFEQGVCAVEGLNRRQALHYFQRCATGREKVLGPSHVDTKLAWAFANWIKQGPQQHQPRVPPSSSGPTRPSPDVIVPSARREQHYDDHYEQHNTSDEDFMIMRRYLPSHVDGSNQLAEREWTPSATPNHSVELQVRPASHSGYVADRDVSVPVARISLNVPPLHPAHHTAASLSAQHQ